MDKFLKIAGVVLVAWIAFGVVGWAFHFLASTVFWVALVAGGVYLVANAVGRSKTRAAVRR